VVPFVSVDEPVVGFVLQLVAVPVLVPLSVATVVTYAELRGRERPGLSTADLAGWLEPTGELH